MKSNSHNFPTNNFFLINSLSQHSFFLLKPNLIQMFKAYHNLYYYVSVYSWNNTLSSAATSFKCWLTSNYTFTSIFPSSSVKDTSRFFKPALGAARFIKKLPTCSRKFLINRTFTLKKYSNVNFLHPKFFPQNKQFYNTNYSLSTPLTKAEDIYFSILPKQKFTITTPISGVGLFFKKTPSALLNSDQLLRRNYFLQTLLKLNKNIRVFTDTQKSPLNYNAFLNLEPTSLKTPKQHPIVGRQLSFLNNYSLNSLDQGSFVATKSQFLLDFYETYTEIYGNTTLKKFNPLDVNQTADFRLKFLTFGGLSTGFFLKQFSQLSPLKNFSPTNLWLQTTSPNFMRHTRGMFFKPNCNINFFNKGTLKNTLKTSNPFGSFFNLREVMIRNRILVTKGVMFQMFRNSKFLSNSLTVKTSVRVLTKKLQHLRKKLPITARLKTLRTLFSTNLLRRKRRNWLSKSNRFFKKLKKQKKTALKFSKIYRTNRLSSLTLLTDASIIDLTSLKTRRVRTLWFFFLKNRLLLNLHRRFNLQQTTSLINRFVPNSNTYSLKTTFLQTYLNHVFTTNTNHKTPSVNLELLNFFQKQFLFFYRKVTQPHKTLSSTSTLNNSNNLVLKNKSFKLPLGIVVKNLGNFFNKKLLNRMLLRLIPFYYFKYIIYLNNFNSTSLNMTSFNSVRNVNLYTKKQNRIKLTPTAHQILTTLITHQKSQWLNWNKNFFNKFEIFWKIYLHRLTKLTSITTSTDSSEETSNSFNLFISRRFKRNVFKKMKKMKKILTKNTKRRYKLIYLFISSVGLRAALYFCKNQTLKKSMHKFLSTLISFKKTSSQLSQSWILGRYIRQSKKLMLQLRKFKPRFSLKQHTTLSTTETTVVAAKTYTQVTTNPRSFMKAIMYFVIDKKNPKIVHINQKNYCRKLKIGSFEHYLNNHLKSRLNLSHTQPIVSLNIFTNLTERTNQFRGFDLKLLHQYQQSTTPFFSRFTLQSRYDLPFIFSNIGFLFITAPQTLWNREYHYDLGMTKSRINSHRYSFFYKNDLKRIYIRKPGLLKLISSFQNNLTLSDSENPFQYRFLKTALEHKNQPAHFKTMSVANQFFYNSIDHYRPLSFYQGIWNDTESSGSEFVIKRIRFKPGYQRIWRNARSALNYTLGFNCRYQVGLTKRLVRLKKIRRKDSMKLQELRLSNVLMSSQFTFDTHSTKQLILSGVVFVNGNNVRNANFNTFVGDFIQLVVNLRYYVIYRWLMNWNNYHTLKFTKLLNFKNNSSRSDLSKQTSQTLPNWIFNVGSRKFDIPKYLEVDFLTLSTFIIYEPLHITDYNPFTYLDSRVEIYTLYNWKFIT